jgi:hypothetical protein
LTQALGFLGTLGLYDGARLIPPEQGRASLPGESLRLDLPPEEL